MELIRTGPSSIPPDAKRIRVTERAQFRSCRRQWSLSSREKLVPINAAADARSLGTAIHEALATFYRTNGEVYAAWESWGEAVKKADLDPEQSELGTIMLEGYMRYADEKDKGCTIAVMDGQPAVELTLFASIPFTDVWLQGTVDLIMDTPRGLFIYDHKSYSSLLSPTEIDFDDQLVGYIWLLQQNGINVRGAYYNQLLKKIPTKPRLLNNGTISKDK